MKIEVIQTGPDWGVFVDDILYDRRTVKTEAEAIELADKLAKEYDIIEVKDVDYTGRGRRSVGGVGFEG